MLCWSFDGPVQRLLVGKSRPFGVVVRWCFGQPGGAAGAAG